MSAPKGRPRFRLNSSSLSESSFAYWLVVPLLILMILIAGFPVLYTGYMSLFDINMMFKSWTFLGLGQYFRAFSDPNVWHALVITLYYTLAVTAICMVVTLAAALFLNKQFVGKPLLMTVMILPWGVSTYATAIIWRYIYNSEWGMLNAALLKLGLIGKYMNFLNGKTVIPLIAIAHTWQLAPLGIYFILASLQLIPLELYKAARVDRLGRWRTFTHITWPYIKHAVMIVMVLVTVEAGRAFDVIYFLTGGGPGQASTTLTYEIYKQTFISMDLGYGSALSVVLIALLTLVTLVYFGLVYRKQREV